MPQLEPMLATTQRGAMNKELLKADIESVLSDKYEVTADKAQPYQLHEALSSAIMKQIVPVWKDSRKAHLATRRACYFSAEFLVGRAIYNNLLCLGPSAAKSVS